jgi:uncharacterized membrane protein YraQ (UPF0718 family)
MTTTPTSTEDSGEDLAATAKASAAATTEPAEQAAPGPAKRWRLPFGSLEILTAALVAVVIFRGQLISLFDTPASQTFATVFVSIVIQAMPFLVFGIVLSALIAVYVPPSFFAKALPKRTVVAVPVAGMAGVALPGCECASVPVAGSLVRRGVPPAAAFAFLLSAPAINPVVLVATAFAFPNDPRMVVCRFVASALAAVAMGWLWLRLGKSEWIKFPKRPDFAGMSKWAAFWASCRHDFIHAGGFLVVGGLTAAVLNVVVPPEWLNAVADNPWLAVIALAGLAVLLSICSEADAFVAASLGQFSLTARLAFLVVGPMIDIKLFAMQVGVFGRSFALRFAPATFVVAVASSVLVGWLLF